MIVMAHVGGIWRHVLNCSVRLELRIFWRVWMPYSGRNKVEFNVFQLLTMCVFDCFLLLNRNDFHDGFK